MLCVPFDVVAAGAMLLVGIFIQGSLGELDGFNDPTSGPIPGSISYLETGGVPVKVSPPRFCDTFS